MKLNVNKWYKNSNLLAITTETNKHICNIFTQNLLQTFPNYVTKEETIIVEDLFKLLDNSYQIFKTVETNLYQNVKNSNNWIDTFDLYNIESHIIDLNEVFDNSDYWREYYELYSTESASEQLFNKFDVKL